MEALSSGTFKIWLDVALSNSISLDLLWAGHWTPWPLQVPSIPHYDFIWSPPLRNAVLCAQTCTSESWVSKLPFLGKTSGKVTASKLNHLSAVDQNNSPWYLHNCQYYKMKTKMLLHQTFCHLVWYIYYFFLLLPRPPHPPHGLSNSAVQAIQSIKVIFRFLGEIQQGLPSWNLNTLYRDTCDSSSPKRDTLNHSQILNEVYITLVIMPHPWKMMKTISKTVSDKDLHIHYQLHPDFFHHSLATATRAPAIIQLHHHISKLPAGPLCHLKPQLLWQQHRKPITVLPLLCTEDCLWLPL